MPGGDFPRVCTEVDHDFAKRINDAFPWGIKSHVMRALLTIAVESVERSGPVMIGAILSGEVRLEYVPGRGVQSLNTADAPGEEENGPT